MITTPRLIKFRITPTSTVNVNFCFTDCFNFKVNRHLLNVNRGVNR